jgi:hypothetical protein
VAAAWNLHFSGYAIGKARRESNMSHYKNYAAAGTALALAAIAWSTPLAQALAASETHVVDGGRPAGLALLGIALLGIGGVFRWAMTKPAPRRADTPRAQEYRSGFRKVQTARPQPRDAVVVELRQVLAARQAKAAAATVLVAPMLPPAESEGFQRQLNDRAMMLRERHATNQAKRRFLRSGVDIHGLASE